MFNLSSELSLITIVSILGSVISFPLVLASYYFYGYLSNKYPKIPKLALLYFCSLVAIFIGIIIVEVYFGYTLPQSTGVTTLT